MRGQRSEYRFVAALRHTGSGNHDEILSAQGAPVLAEALAGNPLDAVSDSRTFDLLLRNGKSEPGEAGGRTSGEHCKQCINGPTRSGEDPAEISTCAQTRGAGQPSAIFRASHPLTVSGGLDPWNDAIGAPSGHCVWTCGPGTREYGSDGGYSAGKFFS